MINAFSVDLEYWWSNEFLKGHQFEKNPNHIFQSTNKLLELLDRYNTKATFFVLGSVAREFPELVEKIYQEGHEIASHGCTHKPIYEMDQVGFEDEIKQSVKIIYKITGEKPRGFRAPSFSINNDTRWAFDVLEKYKFKYDSSIFPIKTMLYGLPNAPLGIYRPSKDDLNKDDPDGKLLEFPMSVMRVLGKNIPLAGGFYLRTIPSWFLKAGLKKINKTRPFITYIHPREIDPDIPVINMPWKDKFIVYNGVNSTLKKLDVLLKNFKFTSIEEVLVQNGLLGRG